MSLFLPNPYRILVIIIGIFAFLDDLIGRKYIVKNIIEIGQLSRGVGMLLVIFIGYYYFGPASILIGLMIQPLNIADMQPGVAVSTVIIMSILVILAILLINSVNYYVPLIILASCIGYAPLDYKGKIMMGEIGNHSFAVALGMSFVIFGGFIGILVLFILTSILIAFLRSRNLKEFMEINLRIDEPYFGDYFMDILSGGGLGDLLRKLLFKDRKIIIKRKLFKILGFRRLFYNPYAS
jgi:UDP-GlcNAc:undecaprenyl-phosphate/decaprenyl-phosphate GlcNAc-1-phosphate transferase